MRQDVYQFYYLICENGHKIYSCGQVLNKEFCQICGSVFYKKCKKCDTPLNSCFSSPVYFGSGEPTNIPFNPGACSNCGEVFPWTLKDRLEHERGVPKDAQEAAQCVRRIINKFHAFVRQIRQRHSDRASIEVLDEYDMQDIFHALLRIYFDDIRREEWTPSYAGGAARVDFYLKDYGIVIELKKTRSGLGDKSLGNQLIEDIARYRVMEGCKILICFVYDPDGRVINPDGIRSDLEADGKAISFELHILPKH